MVLLLTAPGARADILDGTYTLDFTGPQSLWPLEDVDFCESESQEGITIEICVDFAFVSDGAGGVSGTGSITMTISGLLDAMATLNGTIKGKSKGSDTKGVKQTVVFKLSGPVMIGPELLDLKVAGKLLTVISASGLATTTGSVTAGVKGLGSAKAPLGAPIVEQLPSGDWAAVLNVTPDMENKRLTGSIDLMLPGGVVQIPLAGKYNAKKDSSSLKAKGDKRISSQKGISFALKNATSSGLADVSAEAKAKVQGLKLRGAVAGTP
jgi:hypothetical protein